LIDDLMRQKAIADTKAVFRIMAEKGLTSQAAIEYLFSIGELPYKFYHQSLPLCEYVDRMSGLSPTLVCMHCPIKWTNYVKPGEHQFFCMEPGSPYKEYLYGFNYEIKEIAKIILELIEAQYPNPI